jgi:5-methylcytosine-specific restriction endonuclease McrA
MIGVKKLTNKQKEVLRQLVEFICQACKNHEDKVGKLEPHKITPGYKGGKYCPNNIQMLCNSCHKMRNEDW